ncbi:MAG: hypothetical protein JKY65_00380 [Planctomycetes bacterium]|nr:hypothetical protein [Planctomycetota bacterium]
MSRSGSIPGPGGLGRADSCLLAVAILALLSGCVAQRLDSLEARVVEQRVELRSLRDKLADLEATRDQATEVLPPSAVPEERPEVAVLHARITLLEQALEDLKRGAKEPAAREFDPHAKELLIPHEGQTAAPAAGAEVEILSVGSGDLVLGRIRGELERLTLAGVDAPLRPEGYVEDPNRRVRQAAAFGAASVKSEEAWRKSREFLFQRVRGKKFKLRYARPRGARAPNGSLSVVLVDGRIDLNAAVVAAGLALASGPAYRAQEAEARLEKRGLFAASAQGR